MPLGCIVAALVGLKLVLEELLPVLGADLGNFVIANAEFGGVVEDGVDVEGRIGGFTAKLAETMDEVFLEVVGQVVLGAEEDDAALGDCGEVSLAVRET